MRENRERERPQSCDCMIDRRRLMREREKDLSLVTDCLKDRRKDIDELRERERKREREGGKGRDLSHVTDSQKTIPYCQILTERTEKKKEWNV